MPMIRMAMYDQGIQLYCTPTADDRDTWLSTVTHIALEGRCFVFSSCQYLTKDDYPSKYEVFNNKARGPYHERWFLYNFTIGKNFS